jgi:hypothetical protein
MKEFSSKLTFKLYLLIFRKEWHINLGKEDNTDPFK